MDSPIIPPSRENGDVLWTQDRYKYIQELKKNKHILHTSKGMQFLEAKPWDF